MGILASLTDPCLCGGSSQSTGSWGAPSLRATTPSTRRRCRWPRTARSPAGCWGAARNDSCRQIPPLHNTTCFKTSFIVRTEWLECHGDSDFLAKLHCVREACQVRPGVTMVARHSVDLSLRYFSLLQFIDWNYYRTISALHRWVWNRLTEPT